MTTTPRRPWFQIHLSTAVVLMFVAGTIMWIARSIGLFDLNVGWWARIEFAIVFALPTVAATTLYWESGVRLRERDQETH
jgi:hypothetical protein